MDIYNFCDGAARILMYKSRSGEGQNTKYFILPTLSSTNTITMFVFGKVTEHVYGSKTLFYILYFIQFA